MDLPSQPDGSPATSALSPEIAAALRARSAMFARHRSVLPHLHRRIRSAALQPASLRERLALWAARLFEARTAAYAGALAALVLVLSAALFPGRPAAPRAEQTVAAQTEDATRYPLDDAAALSASIDQQIDAAILGRSASARPIAARYVLTSTPASYDSVVAF